MHGKRANLDSKGPLLPSLSSTVGRQWPLTAHHSVEIMGVLTPCRVTTARTGSEDGWSCTVTSPVSVVKGGRLCTVRTPRDTCTAASRHHFSIAPRPISGGATPVFLPFPMVLACLRPSRAEAPCPSPGSRASAPATPRAPRSRRASAASLPAASLAPSCFPSTPGAALSTFRVNFDKKNP